MKKDLAKKLLIWDGKGRPREDNKLYAEDYYCVVCYSDKKEIQAEKFFGLNDPDASRAPYCQKCIDKFYIELWKSNPYKNP